MALSLLRSTRTALLFHVQSTFRDLVVKDLDFGREVGFTWILQKPFEELISLGFQFLTSTRLVSDNFWHGGNPLQKPGYLCSTLQAVPHVTTDGGYQAHTRGTVEKLQEFQAAARKDGFVEVEECDGGSILWLRKTIADAPTKTHQRICLDSHANNATIYWMSAVGKIESKTFRAAISLQQWFASRPAES